jgi:hypothetical protein
MAGPRFRADFFSFFIFIFSLFFPVMSSTLLIRLYLYCSMVWYGMVCMLCYAILSMLCYGMVWYGILWYTILCYGML